MSADDRISFFGEWPHFVAHDPLHLVQEHPEAARELKLWLDVGKNDPWRGAVARLREELDAAGILHAWREYQGDHDGDYWRANVGDYLRFYSRSFRSMGPHNLSASTATSVSG